MIKLIRQPELIEGSVYEALKNYASGEGYISFLHYEISSVPERDGTVSVRVYDSKAGALFWISIKESVEQSLRTIIRFMEEQALLTFKGN